MYKVSYKLFIVCLLSATIFLSSCKKFLEQPPQGLSIESTLNNKAGIQGLLTGAYSLLDGVGSTSGDSWRSSITNWIYGGVASDDAHKGSADSDQDPIRDIMKWTALPTNAHLNSKWQTVYASVQRANEVIRALGRLKAGEYTEVEMATIKAEAVFLRGVYHLEAAKIWKNVPYINEMVTYEADNYNVDNDGPIWAEIEADFKFAAANLPATQKEAGRANSWAAKAFLAKTYMFDGKFTEAQVVLKDLITNGVTAKGIKYALSGFSQNFNAKYNNTSESVFAAQMTVNDGSNRTNSNNGDVLNWPYGGQSSCCGFYQPSFSLVNSFKTDPVTGLPYLDTWNDVDMKNDYGLTMNNPFTPYSGTVDPRLDYTAGRRGIPMLDWGVMKSTWVRAQVQGGPYLAIKHLFYVADAGSTSESSENPGSKQHSSNNYEMIRFADVLLWAAECEVEVGTIDKAQEYVNMVRNRAADPSDWVKSDVAGGSPDYGGYAAKYFVKPYPPGDFAAHGQNYARKAVRFERKLELALEGHRFFDLQRYDKSTGYMADVLNAYAQHEGAIGIPILQGAHFTKGTNELFPIPQNQIDQSKKGREGVSALKQNPGY